eukprot:GDKI01020063.1.p2 GENE.GDKI01020063.1~~GDKI01020063.1.p2  ORF type:complete len:192 (-),score=82.42 GDKI01020063.1:261-836(-)
MRIEKCWFCSSNIYPGHGVVFVRNDAKVFRFCRSKCHRHFKAKHNPRKLRWTKAYRKAAGKEMTVDSTFDFEKRRNRPIRYDRNLMIKTIQAMKIVDRIKQVRKERFHRIRLAAQRQLRKSMAEKELAKGMDLLEGIKVPEKRTQEMLAEVQSSRVAEKTKGKNKLKNKLAGDDVGMDGGMGGDDVDMMMD